MRGQTLSAIVCASLVSTLACSAPINTGYLDQQAVMQPGQFMDGVWCDDQIDQPPTYSQVRVVSVEARGIEDRKGVSTDDAVSWLREQLAQASDESNDDDVLLTLPGEGPVASLELAITEMTPGSVAGRFWGGEFGAGHAFVQVEGKLTDASEGALLCELVQRARASGAVGFRDWGGDAGPAMVEEMLGLVAQALIQELRVKLQGSRGPTRSAIPTALPSTGA